MEDLSKNLSNNNTSLSIESKRESKIKQEINVKKNWKGKVINRFSLAFRNRLPESSKSCCQSKIETLAKQQKPSQVRLGEMVINESKKSKILSPFRAIVKTLRRRDMNKCKSDAESPESDSELIN